MKITQNSGSLYDTICAVDKVELDAAKLQMQPLPLFITFSHFIAQRFDVL